MLSDREEPNWVLSRRFDSTPRTIGFVFQAGFERTMSSPRVSLRHCPRFVVIAIAMILAVGPLVSFGRVAHAQDDSGGSASYWDSDLNVEIPGSLGQTDLAVYVPDTEHTVQGYMLDYWRSQGASAVYGNPVSEPYGAADGYYSQAFAGAIFQFRADYLWNDSPTMTLQPIGSDYLKSKTAQIRRDGKRAGGGGDRRASAYRTYGADSGTAQKTAAAGGVFDTTTGHSINSEFLTWYNDNEGSWYLGSPLTQPVDQHGVTVQYFQGAVLQRDASGTVSVVPIVSRDPDAFGVDTSPVAQQGLPTFDESLFATAANPNPIGDQNATGRKWIEVSLSQQTAWVYQGDTVISSTLVSTGLEPNPTAPGWFHVRLKMPTQDMKGAVNSDGQVVALGEDAENAANDGTVADESGYVVPDVPNVMYFNMEAEALHGAYWHHNFGNPMSHGCINLPLDFASWLYGWAPLGTEVVVHE